MRQIDVSLDKLVVSKLNARKDLQAGQEDSGIEELARSIQKQGVLSPLVVRPTSEDTYEVVAGQRRLVACQKIKLDPVPCLIRDDIDDVDAVTISLVENVHRADMHPLDKARALDALYGKHQSYERVAKESAWSISTVRKYIALLNLPEELQKRIGTSAGPAGINTLSRLAKTFSEDQAVEVFEKISGFTQKIQEEILKKSGGDIESIDHLVSEAQEGAFDVRRCGGTYGCEIVRDLLEGELSQAEFEQLIHDVAENLGSDLPKGNLRRAAWEFWKALARQ
jgi:ParB family chromosome partitioning protein